MSRFRGQRSGMPQSSIEKHSVQMEGWRTSFSIEDELFPMLKMIAQHQGLGLSPLIQSIDESRQRKNLSSAIRLYMFRYLLLHFGDWPLFDSIVHSARDLFTEPKIKGGESDTVNPNA